MPPFEGGHGRSNRSGAIWVGSSNVERGAVNTQDACSSHARPFIRLKIGASMAAPTVYVNLAGDADASRSITWDTSWPIPCIGATVHINALSFLVDNVEYKVTKVGQNMSLHVILSVIRQDRI